jgi:uncharacterized protein (DUF1015 family)
LATVPQLHPFRGLRYDRRVVGDVSAVLCPPYDVISPERREALAARHERNAVHVELPSSYTPPPDSVYQQAGRTFAAWRSDGTLLRDEHPQIYIYEQTFSSARGESRRACGFYCRLTLEQFGPDGGVRPHERTMAAPKEDRYRLLSAVGANLSPVLMLYDAGDEGATSVHLLDRLADAEPVLEGVDDDGVGQRLWAIDPAQVPAAGELLTLAGSRPLTIADGHHRYETALRYRDARRATGDAAPGAEQILVLLYDAYSSGLQVLPTHRLVSGGPRGGQLLDDLTQYFALTPVDDAAAMVTALHEPGQLGVWSGGQGALLAVDREKVEHLIPTGASEALRWLDVTVLAGVMASLYGRDAHEMASHGALTYTKDAGWAAAQVDEGQADALFLLPPAPTAAVLEIAAAGEQMPHKSTYFQPKAATGVVFAALDE